MVVFIVRIAWRLICGTLNEKKKVIVTETTHTHTHRYGALAKCRASAGQELMGAKTASRRHCKCAIFLLSALEDLIRSRKDADLFQSDFKHIESFKSMLRQSLARGMMNE